MKWELVEDVGGAAPAIDVVHFRFVLPFPDCFVLLCDIPSLTLRRPHVP